VSRSWTERLGRRKGPSAGLALGRDYAAFAEVAASGRVTELREVAFDSPLFGAAPFPAAANALDRALQIFSKSIQRRYLPLHVSVPDPLVHWSVFELDELPSARAAQHELVAFRFSRQGLNGGHRYACQPLGREAGKHLVLGMATDGAWHELIAAALARAGLVAWTINANACRQFNAFHDRLVEASGALVAAAPDAWSLTLWDGEGRLRYARGRWRSGSSDAEIAAEVERAILAYVHADPAREVSRIFVVGEAAVADALDARMRAPCERLSFHETLAGSRPAPCAPLVFAAALEQ
jgi:hypothetical protein